MKARSSKQALLANAVGQTLVSMAPIASGLILLPANDFGRLALLQLFYAWAVSLMLSTVEEVAPRKLLPRHIGDMDTVALLLAVTLSILGAATVSVSARNVSLLPLAFAVLFFAPRYFTRRYRIMRSSPTSSFLPVDLLVFILMISFGGVAILVGAFHLQFILLGWATSCCIGLRLQTRAADSEVLGRFWDRICRWFAFRSRRAQRLVIDSTLLDGSALLMPGVVASMLGPSVFGSWRSIATLSSPINVGMSVMRPRLVASAGRPAHRLEMLLAVVGVGWGTAVYYLLPALYPWSQAVAGLEGLELEVALLTSLRFISIPAYYKVRGLAEKGLVRFRAIDSAINILLPVFGVLIGGLRGVLIGGVSGAVLSSIIWVSAAQLYSRKGVNEGK